jgi:hypothetical protein
MDGQRFDSMARALASGMPRRNALKALAGLGVTGIGAQTLGSQAAANGMCAPENEYCDPQTPCCEPLVCILHLCGQCLDEGETLCGGPADCCHGLKCDGGKCVKDKKSDCKGKECKHKKHRHH